MAFADAGTGALILNADENVQNVELEESCHKGDLIGYSSGYKRALATTGGVIQAKGIALMDGQDGDVIPVCFGKVMLGGRLSGMTPGNPLYAAEGTDNGEYTDTQPSTSGDADKQIGVAITTTVAVIDPNAQVDSTAT